MVESRRSELVLASTSASRRRLLEAAGLSFRVVPSQVDERKLKRGLAGKEGRPETVAVILARAKAEAVSRKLAAALVIGADQVLALGDDVFDKPADVAEAREHLARLRGREHRLLTAVSLAVDGRSEWVHVQSATLVMRSFSDEFLERYLASADSSVTSSVGAYQIEAFGIQLFERIEGDYFTILGLPLLALLAALRARGEIDT